MNKPYSWSSETVCEGEFTVSISGDKLLFENMFVYKVSGMNGYEYKSGSYYGTLSSDGKTITLDDVDPNGMGHGQFGPLSFAGGPIVLTIEDNTLKVASAYNGNVANYVATKK